MPDWMSAERQQLIRSYGAEIVPVSHAQGGFLGSIRMAEQMAAREPRIFLPRQFSNQANSEARAKTTGREILLQLEESGLGPPTLTSGHKVGKHRIQGISSGCNFLAALLAQKTLGGDAVVVTVFAGDNKKYLTTDLMREEPVKPGYLSAELELTGIRVLPRHCRACVGRLPAD
jgi:cysteine synthase A